MSCYTNYTLVGLYFRIVSFLFTYEIGFHVTVRCMFDMLISC